MEYDVEIEPPKLVKIKCLEKLLAGSNCEALGHHLITEQPIQEELQAEKEKEKIMEQYAKSTWYADICTFPIVFTMS